MTVVEEDMLVIRIAPTTPGTVFTSKILLGISVVPIWVLFRERVKHMLDVNASVEMLVVDAITTAHAGDVSVEEDSRFHRLKLIGLTPAVEDVDTDYAVHRTELNLEEERIDS